MVRNEFMKFHKTYPMNAFLEEVRRLEKEKELMFSYLPGEYQSLQKKIEEVCDRMEYEGSRMYDEHPDKDMMGQMIKKFCQENDYEEDIANCFFWNEIFRRRFLRWMRKSYIK